MANIYATSSCSMLMKAIDSYIEKADKKLMAKLKASGFLLSKETVDKITELEDVISEILEKENNNAIKAAKKSNSVSDFSDNQFSKFKDKDKTAKLISEAVENSYSELLPGLIDAYLKQSDAELSFLSVTDKTNAWVKNWSSELAEMMQLSSHEKIEELLTNHLENGSSIDDLVRELQSSGIRNERYRARTTAVTEVLRAHSMAHNEATMQNPSVSDKKWRHTGMYHNDPRKNHQKIDGQQVAKDKPFVLIGADGSEYHPMYPRDINLPASESINCHCIYQDIVDESILALTLDERQKMQQQAIDDMNSEWEKELNERNKSKAGIKEK